MLVQIYESAPGQYHITMRQKAGATNAFVTKRRI